MKKFLTIIAFTVGMALATYRLIQITNCVYLPAFIKWGIEIIGTAFGFFGGCVVSITESEE